MKARVLKLIGGKYDIVTLDKEKKVYTNITARGKLRAVTLDEKSSFRKQKTFRTKLEKKTEALSPKVGDIVNYEIVDNDVFIYDILPRENELVRPPLANIDKVILVFSAVEPDFSFTLLETFLVILEIAHIVPFLLVTKIDKISEENLSSLKKKLSYYEKIGLNIAYVNNKKLGNLESLRGLFKDQVIALAGQTGVGKSSFLNAINPNVDQKTNEISRALGRGKHTTRHSELFPFLGGYIADTPGFSRVDLEILYADELKRYYPDFIAFSTDCEYKSKCNHMEEPDCEVKRQVEKGIILKERYDIYRDFFVKIRDQKRKY